ncbi:deoxynucleoside kinase-like isoform X1 [Amphibalanus amphitrite]|uniref:deoxynucleoside kinase-like isoform X1 n=2 Tax=Amphibalanus amphitrite TaxID=1232801 RepID=UPI001C901A53|nr:deoxynucleoside kinase-like isoform X1 [Amphibalanus amphitrite]
MPILIPRQEVLRWLVPLVRWFAKMPALQHPLALAPSSKKELMLDTGPRPFTVSVEGNVGSGKSTFLKHFKGLEGVNVIEEPLEKWCNVDGHNLLDKLYKDPERWSFLFQSYIQLTRLQIHLDKTPCRVKIIERSLPNNRYCFVENALDSGAISAAEHTVLAEYYSLMERRLDIGVDLIVYLRTTPEVVFERMRQRGRAEEAAVPLDYLRRVHRSHERWLTGARPAHWPPVLCIDADQELKELLALYDKNKERITGGKV